MNRIEKLFHLLENATSQFHTALAVKEQLLAQGFEELTLKEISNVLEVSESRISQLHTRALQKMKDKMGKYMGIFN